MSASIKQFGMAMMSGEDKSWPASAARLATRTIEPFYSGVMAIRNACYDRGIFRVHDLGRPTISVGNITTGGTGKTPVVGWICEQLQQRGRRPAVLLRGYGEGTFSDEAQLLKQALKEVPVEANPSRVAGAAAVLTDHPEVDVFVLDDAFQHRKVRRDFNLVLISATRPFGFGHVLPRGLLRESLEGLGRADAFLVTRCSLGADEVVDRFLEEHHPSVSVFHCDHQMTGVRDMYEGKRVFLTAGIGDPAAFEKQISELGCQVVGRWWYSDHHVFTASEMFEIDRAAETENADVVLTTEKDWVKMKSQLPQASAVPIGVVKLELGFRNEDGARLIERMMTVISSLNGGPARPGL